MHLSGAVILMHTFERPSADAARPNPGRVTPPRPTPGGFRWCHLEVSGASGDPRGRARGPWEVSRGPQGSLAGPGVVPRESLGSSRGSVGDPRWALEHVDFSKSRGGAVAPLGESGGGARPLAPPHWPPWDPGPAQAELASLVNCLAALRIASLFVSLFASLSL